MSSHNASKVSTLENITQQLEIAVDLSVGSRIELVEQAGSVKPGDIALCSMAASNLAIALMLLRVIEGAGSVSTYEVGRE